MSKMSKCAKSLQDLNQPLKTCFPGLTNCEEWVITNLSYTKDVLWNILMCYCIQSSKAKRCNFIYSLDSSRKIRYFIRNFIWNPFDGKAMCRTSKYVPDLSRLFEKKIQDYHSTNENKFYSKHKQYINLQASSILLDINILLIIKQKDEFGKDKVHTKLFPDPADTKQILRAKCLVLVDDVIGTSEMFSFCLTQKIGFKCRKLVLESVLSSDLGMNLALTFPEICSFHVEKNVLLYILKCAEFEKILYNFPYFLDKLQTAGFLIDSFYTLEQILKHPDCRDLRLELNDKYMPLFYNIVLDRTNPLWSKSPHIYPDVIILQNFERFYSIVTSTNLASDLSSTENDFNQKIKIMHSYNEFVVDICSKVGKINREREKNFLNCSINAFYEAKHIGNIIKSILAIYKKHLNQIYSVIDTQKQFENEFVKCMNFNVSVMYLDHLFIFANNLVIPSENLQILTEFAKILLEFCLKEKHHNEEFDYSDWLSTNCNKALNFIDHPYKISERKDQDMDIIFKQHMPEIYKNLLISQLRHYLNFFEFFITFNLKESMDKLTEKKYLLIVDRGLQIIETFLRNISNVENDTLEIHVIKYLTKTEFKLLTSLLFHSKEKRILGHKPLQNIQKFVKILEDYQKPFMYSEKYTIYDVSNIVPQCSSVINKYAPEYDIDDQIEDEIIDAEIKNINIVYETMELSKIQLHRKEAFEITESFKTKLKLSEIPTIKIHSKSKLKLTKGISGITEESKTDLEKLRDRNEIYKITKSFKTKLKLREELSTITKDAKTKLKFNEEISGTKEGSKSDLEKLRDWIELLKEILIDTEESIQEQWENNDDQENDLCLCYRLTQLYLSDLEIQVMTEMLLYHCMNILKTDELKYLWNRTSSVFNTVNIRNTLMRNENSKTLVYPLDVFNSSSSFIKKCMQLIADVKIINNILKIVKQTGVDLYGFLNIMKYETSDEFGNLIEDIITCDRWKEYALLIPWEDSYGKPTIQEVLTERCCSP